MNVDKNESTRRLLIRAREGDQSAREALVRENIALVKFIVKRFLDRGVEYDDLFQYGCLGLLKAIDRFDPEFQVQFSTYAVPVIMGEIRRFLRDDGPVHVSRTIYEQARKVERYCAEYQAAHGQRPDVGQVADHLKISREDVVLALNSRNRVRSLDEPVKTQSDLRLMDVVGDECMQKVDQRLMLAKLLRDLSDQERNIILRRYFKCHTQTEIARDMGISQVQVSRMEARILKRMRQMSGMDDEKCEPAGTVDARKE